MSKQLKKEYLQDRVNPIIHRIVTDLLVTMPDDVIGFIRNWVDKKGDNFATNQSTLSRANTKNAHYSDESDVDEDEEEDEIGELPTNEQIIAQNKSRNFRQSVSSEVYGQFNQRTFFKPKVVPKSEDQKARIRQRLSQAFMFSALDEKEQDIVIDAMEEKTFEKGEIVINQGDAGDLLYVVDSGLLACHKQFSGKPEPTFLKNYEPGESFGELALLYNAPRAATITATEKSVLFALDRETFNHIVKDATMRKRQSYEDFLSNLELLSNMDAYERSKIADAAKSVKFSAGEYIVKEGEKGDVFYFVEEGEAYATKIVNKDEPAKEVFQYKPGSYFGELALLKDVPRQASVIARTDVKVVALERMTFKRLLGPLEKILSRNTTKYEGATGKRDSLGASKE